MDDRVQLMIGGKTKGRRGGLTPIDGEGTRWHFTSSPDCARRWLIDDWDEVNELVDLLNKSDPRYEFKVITVLGDFYLCEPNMKPSSSRQVRRARRP